MATQGMFNLFGASPEEIRAKYEQGLMGKPRGGGLGRQLGYTVGRMLGGRLPGEAEAEAQQAALLEAQQSGLNGSALYKRLAQTTADPRRALAFGQQAAQMEAAEAKAAQDAQDAALERRKTLAETLKIESELANKPDALQNFAELEALDSEGKYTKSQLVFAAQNPKTFDSVRNELVKRPAAAKPMDYGDVRESLSMELFGKNAAGLTPQQFTRLNRVALERELQKVRAQRGDEALLQPAKAMSFYKEEVKVPTEQLEAARNAQQSIKLAVDAFNRGEKNPIAFEGARSYLTKALDDRPSNQDIERMGRSPGIIQSVKNFLSSAATEIPDQKTVQDILDFAMLMEQVNVERQNKIVNRYRKITELPEASKSDWFPREVVKWNALSN